MDRSGRTNERATESEPVGVLGLVRTGQDWSELKKKTRIELDAIELDRTRLSCLLFELAGWL